MKVHKRKQNVKTRQVCVCVYLSLIVIKQNEAEQRQAMKGFLRDDDDDDESQQESVGGEGGCDETHSQ